MNIPEAASTFISSRDTKTLFSLTKSFHQDLNRQTISCRKLLVRQNIDFVTWGIILKVRKANQLIIVLASFCSSNSLLSVTVDLISQSKVSIESFCPWKTTRIKPQRLCSLHRNPESPRKPKSSQY